MVRAIGFGGGLALLLASCSAQVESPSEVAPVQGVELSLDEKRALAHRYVVALEMEATQRAMLEGLVEQTIKAVCAGKSYTPEKIQAIRAAVVEGGMAMLPETLEVLERLTAETFSSEELLQMVAFYESDIGQSIVDKGPSFAALSIEEMGPIMAAGQIDIRHRICDVAPEAQGCKAS